MIGQYLVFLYYSKYCGLSVGIDWDRPTKRLRGAYLSRVGIERLSAVWVKELNESEPFDEVSKRIKLHQKQGSASPCDNYKIEFLNGMLIGCTALRRQDFYLGLRMEQENQTL